MADNFFIHDIIIHKQSIRGLHYTSKFGEELDFSNFELNEYSLNYDVLTHKKKKRDHLIILEFVVSENSTSKSKSRKQELKNEFVIVVEGHYEVPLHVDEKNVKEAVHFAGLANIVAFLRTSVQGITSFHGLGPFYLPPISLEVLHKQYQQNKKARQQKQKN